MIAQEHLTATPLPPQMADVVDVPDQVGFFETDDVTVLYYDSPDDAKAFREQNPDLMERIGAFNKTHVTDFVYVNGVAER